VRPDLLPPLPVIAVTPPLAVRPDLLPPLPVLAVTPPLSVRPDLLPPLPVIAVTQPVSLRADLAPAAIQHQTRVAPLFLPMPVPTRITLTPRVSLRAELLPQRVQAQLPPGRRYGLQNRNSRITLRVHSPTIVAIRDARNQIFIDRELAPGDTYRVPNRVGLWLTAIDAGAVEIVLDGASVGFAGAQGAVLRDLPLNPQSIANRERRTSS
jgi:cytoskeleton protein RodZ